MGGNESVGMAGASVADVLLKLETAQSSGESAEPFAQTQGFYWQIKRPLEFSIALVAAALCLPIFLSITLVLAHEGHPVFIRRKRLSQYGRPFTTYSFRTMPLDSLRTVVLDAPRTSTRATDALGRILARTQLDRMPLLFNVLRGDMNLIGPRAMLQEELIGSGRLARHSLSVRPGLTGLWWVDGDYDLRRRLASDRAYIERASPLLDLRIALRTVALIHGI